MKLLNHIQEHSFFANFDSKYLPCIADVASEACLYAGYYFFREGETADLFYLIHSGRVELSLSDEIHGTKTVLQNLGEGDVVGISWIIPPYKRRFDAKALSQTYVTVIDGRKLRELCEINKALGYDLLKRFISVFLDRLTKFKTVSKDIYKVSERI